jgi:sec-independent protein translocase protein TatA
VSGQAPSEIAQEVPAMRVGGLGAPELILIVLALVLVFGASKLGEIGGQLGKTVREFKKATQEDGTPAAADPMPAPPSPAPAQLTVVKLPDYQPAGTNETSASRPA